MESLKKDSILQFPPDTMKVVRKEFGLDKPGEMDRAIDILEIWLKKQNHFMKKDFSRDYLERTIIRAKGSVERSKERLDKLCTGRSLLPLYFGIHNVKESVDLGDHLYDAICPKLTDEYNRVYIIHVHNTENLSSQLVTDFYKKVFYLLEYFCAHDYASGLVIVYDFTHLNVIEFIKILDIAEAARLVNLALNGFGLRVKQIHVVSASKLINMLVSMFKQVISEKLASRIQCHSNVDGLHQYIDKEVLPKDLGGTEHSLKELHERWLDVLTSEDFMSEIKETCKARVDESIRPIKTQNDNMGLAGTFRTLCVD